MQEGYVHIPCMQNEGGACTTNSISPGAERTEQRDNRAALPTTEQSNGDRPEASERDEYLAELYLVFEMAIEDGWWGEARQLKRQI